jgi:hypothetical protein
MQQDSVVLAVQTLQLQDNSWQQEPQHSQLLQLLGPN